MAVAFTPSQELGRSDLDIFLENSMGNPVNAYSITFAIFYVDPDTHDEVLIGDPARVPANPSVGEYYAAIMIPNAALVGDYRIRWTFKELASSSNQQVVQEFAVVSTSSTTPSTYSTAEQALIATLRILLRDSNPDRNYKFRPPEHEGTIGAYNQVFGYIWEDAELYEYLKVGLDYWNSMPPETESLKTLNTLVSSKPVWRTPVLYGAMIFAYQALMTNWISEEFSVFGETPITVTLQDGSEEILAIQDLWTACNMASTHHLKDNFLSGNLRIKAVDPVSGNVSLSVISDVVRHASEGKECVRVTTSSGKSAGFTVDHSLFVFDSNEQIVPIQASELQIGSQIAIVCQDELVAEAVASIEPVENREYTYDLCVPGPENFVLTNGILAHNSYSVGGISLDIERSSKYEAAMSNAQQQFTTLTEAKARTTKYIRGLRQPRFNTGVRSSFGPNTGSGTLSPRKYSGF